MMGKDGNVKMGRRLKQHRTISVNQNFRLNFKAEVNFKLSALLSREISRFAI